MAAIILKKALRAQIAPYRQGTNTFVFVPRVNLRAATVALTPLRAKSQCCGA